MEKEIKERKDVLESDKWDLTTIYKSNEEWEKDISKIPELTKEIASYKGKLSENAGTLLCALKSLETLSRIIDKAWNYASLKLSEDEGNPDSLDREGRITMAYSKMQAEISFFEPELLNIQDEKINEWISGSDFDDYRIFIKKILHHKAHTLSEKEERLLSLEMESARTAENAFGMLTNVDLQFESVTVDGEKQPLTQSTYGVFLQNPNRAVREEAYKKFYAGFNAHANTLASLYAGSVNHDVFVSRVRGYSSSLEMGLFSDKVDESVYRNLIATVHKNLPDLHRYYSLRKKVLGLSELRHWDVSVPLVKGVKMTTKYEDAVEICRAALSVLGKEYTDTISNGLLNGWVDRYENKGKRSGAFSSGAYTGYPYILLNYKEDDIRDVFTMAHEGGHSMHSFYSAQSNPFMHYSYTIFEAEVASTFNEELVFEYLLKEAKDESVKKYLLSMRAADIVSTLHRQTMFAEFELLAHESVENGTPLSADVLRKIYRSLLETYFGPEMIFEKESDLEGLRIPHFYGAFYVYKYATGISASLALASRVSSGGEKEREDYFKFLRSGGSRYPIESLRIAGVDMASTTPVQSALNTFKKIVEELESSL